MKSIKETIYLHRNKEKNWELEDRCEELHFETKTIPYIGYEITVEIEIFENGHNRVLSINGIDISEKNIQI